MKNSAQTLEKLKESIFSKCHTISEQFNLKKVFCYFVRKAAVRGDEIESFWKKALKFIFLL